MSAAIERYGRAVITTLEVNRDDLATTRAVESTPTLDDGEVLARIDYFALTSNNVTYAVIGHTMGYWDFFPPGPDDSGESVKWGRVPAFGYAEIEQSRCDGVEVGTRIYGYFPMASHVVLQPGRIGTRAFTDMAPHRQPMSEVYNRYSKADADPLHDADRERQRMLLHPLFTTSFVIDDFFADSDFFGAATAVISSASAKTAIGCAHLMSRRDGLRVVGLTSAANREFVERLQCYSEVVTYDAVDAIAPDSAVYIDISGSGTVRHAVHTHFGDQLAFSSAVGATDWEGMGGGSGSLPGPTPEFFFAPTQISKRNEEWGRDEMDQRIVAAWTDYSAWTDSWLELVDHTGADALSALWQEMLPGRVDPSLGHVVSLTSRP